MVELKPGWKRVKFGEVVRQVKDKVAAKESGLGRYIAGEHMDTDDLQLRRWGEINDNYLGPAFHMRFRPGQVLYGSRRTYLRKVAVADFEGICANTTFVVESKNPVVLLPELLPFVMTAEPFHEHSVRESKGSVNPYVNFSDLAWYEFALPPLEEQRRLAGAAWHVASLLDAVRKAESSLDHMRRRLAESFDYAPSVWHPVGELLAEPLMRGWSLRCNDSGDGYATLPAGCVYTGMVDTKSNRKYAVLEDAMYQKYELHHEDVLLLRGNGNRALVGRAGFVAERNPDCFFPDLLVRLRFDRSLIHPLVASTLINSVDIHRQLSARSKSTNGIWKLGFDDIRQHRIPVPSSEVQGKIAAALSTWRTAYASLARRRLACANLIRKIIDHPETVRV